MDTNAELMARSNAHCEELGIKGARFHAAPIGHHVPDPAPDIVLALHACDTATDDALALAVRHVSREAHPTAEFGCSKTSSIVACDARAI